MSVRPGRVRKFPAAPPAPENQMGPGSSLVTEEFTLFPLCLSPRDRADERSIEDAPTGEMDEPTGTCACQDAYVATDDLLERARSVLRPRQLSSSASCGGVGAALESANGDVLVGVCIDTDSSLGFCAEHAAAAAMLTSGESVVVRMVAVNSDGSILAPCGRCREFISQLAPANMDTMVLVNSSTEVRLGRSVSPCAPVCRPTVVRL